MSFLLYRLWDVSLATCRCTWYNAISCPSCPYEVQLPHIVYDTICCIYHLYNIALVGSLAILQVQYIFSTRVFLMCLPTDMHLGWIKRNCFIVPISMQLNRCSRIWHVFHIQNRGSRPWANSVAMAMAKSPQSELFGCRWTFTGWNSTWSLLGCHKEQICYLVFKLRKL